MNLSKIGLSSTVCDQIMSQFDMTRINMLIKIYANIKLTIIFLKDIVNNAKKTFDF